MLKSERTLKNKQSLTLQNPITSDVVRQHLKELGYDENVLDQNALQDFVQELQSLWLHEEELKNDLENNTDTDHGHPEIEMVDSEFKSNNYSSETISGVGGNKIIRQNYTKNMNQDQLYFDSYRGGDGNGDRHDLQHSEGQQEKKLNFNHQYHEYNPPPNPTPIQEKINVKKAVNLEGFRLKVQQQKMISETRNDDVKDYDFLSDKDISDTDISLISRPTTASSIAKLSRSGFIKVPQTNRPKKNDPVSRYHQHQAEWNKDGFLKRLNARDPVREQGRWGGMATPFHEVPIKVRHDLNAKRTDYVIPSQKKRAGLIWATRSQMALDRS